jgi:hypothetical protein
MYYTLCGCLENIAAVQVKRLCMFCLIWSPSEHDRDERPHVQTDVFPTIHRNVSLALNFCGLSYSWPPLPSSTGIINSYQSIGHLLYLEARELGTSYTERAAALFSSKVKFDKCMKCSDWRLLHCPLRVAVKHYWLRGHWSALVRQDRLTFK